MADFRIGISSEATINSTGAATVRRRWTITNLTQERMEFKQFFFSAQRPSRDVKVEAARDSQDRDLLHTTVSLDNGDSRMEVDFGISNN